MNIKTILLTGSRAPATLDLARRLHKEGHRVLMADSLSPTLSQFSRACTKHYTIAKPSDNETQFALDLQKIIGDEGVDLLIPMCEEVLYISRQKNRFSCAVLTMDFPLIHEMHNKWLFSKMIESCSIQTPWTKLIENEEDTKSLPDEKLIFKRIYSRFAAGILVKERGDPLPKLDYIKNNPFIAQKFIEGEHLCTYSIAKKGNLQASSEYFILQSMGIGSAISFVSTSHPKIYKFIQEFVAKTNYTGQISFDFIKDRNGTIYCLECNPRATSGLHLFTDTSDFLEAFLGAPNQTVLPKNEIYKRDLLFCFWFGIKQGDIFSKLFWISIFKGSSPLFTWKDFKVILAIPYILFQICKKTLLQQKGFHEVMSRDVEYNGEL